MAEAQKPTSPQPQTAPPKPTWVPPKADPKLIGDINRGYQPVKPEQRSTK
jgi:hypothetical protein